LSGRADPDRRITGSARDSVESWWSLKQAFLKTSLD
jgi:hypothetical protein